MNTLGTVAFITTPTFRSCRTEEARHFIYENLYPLCVSYRVLMTGRTGTFVDTVLDDPPSAPALEVIRASMGQTEVVDRDLERWRRTIRQNRVVAKNGLEGMIQVANELVEGRLDAVIHLTDWADRISKADSATLARMANVYDVPIASDPPTAVAYITEWKRRQLNGERVFVHREQPPCPPLDGLSERDQVLAIIAHDNMKLDTCLFVVEHSRQIFENYDYVLSTGTTGRWLQRFMKAAGRSPADVKRIHCCKSGPQGGDIQIAYAIVTGLCHKAIFFQDPTVSHAHDVDIRLFEQAVVAPSVHVQLATNAESARLLILGRGRRQREPVGKESPEVYASAP